MEFTICTNPWHPPLGHDLSAGVHGGDAIFHVYKLVAPPPWERAVGGLSEGGMLIMQGRVYMIISIYIWQSDF